MMTNSSDVKNQKNIRGFVFVLFFFSGISGLIYEIVWTRKLTYIFGSTIYAVTTVLTCFMAGLAIGSYIFGRYIDKSTIIFRKGNSINPIKVYAFLEIGIGVFGILIPFILKSFVPIYSLIYNTFHTSFFTFSLIRFIFIFLLLIIPTSFMGGTVPVLSKFLIRSRETSGLNLGLLYALNTFGAVLGSFLSGFILIASIGIWGTTFFAAIINFAVAFIALFLSKKVLMKQEIDKSIRLTLDKSDRNTPLKVEVGGDGTQLGGKISKSVLFFIILVYGLSGFAGLSYQVVWTRALVFSFHILKNTTYAFSGMLTIFLLGLALGSLVITKFIDREKNPIQLFGLIEVLIGLSGFFSIKMILSMSGLFEPALGLSETEFWFKSLLAVFFKSFLVMFLPTFLMGMTFPIVGKIILSNGSPVCHAELVSASHSRFRNKFGMTTYVQRIGKDIGKIYAVNTFGAILGSFITGFFLIPFAGLAKSILIMAILNILSGGFVIFINPASKKVVKNILFSLTILAILIILIRYPRGIIFHNLAPSEKMVFYKEGPLATVSVVENTLGYRAIYVDNVWVAGTDPILQTDQKSLAHIPMLLHKNPKSILTVGFGSGGASYSYSLYPDLEKIHCVEISSTVIEAAKYLVDANHNILEKSDSRYKIIIDDARSYLTLADVKYDIIATDCTDLRYKSNANLYDLEYFTLCKKRINPDGMVVVWMPIGGLNEYNFKMTLNTFHRMFPNMSIWYLNNIFTHYILLIGTNKPSTIDFDTIAKRLEIETVKDDLSEIYLNNPYKIVSCFITNEEKLSDYLKNASINSENFPGLEFLSPKSGYTVQPMLDNLNTLKKLRMDVKPLLTNTVGDAYMRPSQNINESKCYFQLEKLEKYLDAVDYILDGHYHYMSATLSFTSLRDSLIESCKWYIKAYKTNPEDLSVLRLLDNEFLIRRVKLYFNQSPDNPEKWAPELLGDLYYLQASEGVSEKRYSEALRYYNKVLPVLFGDSKVRVLKKIAQIFLDVKQPDKALNYLNEALAITPDNKEIQSMISKIKNPS